MFDMSWGEVMVIGTVALIVIGPKDLPKTLRMVGQVTGKLRGMANEFQSQFNEAMREAELHEVKTGLDTMSESLDPLHTVRKDLQRSPSDTRPLQGPPAPARTNDEPKAS